MLLTNKERGDKVAKVNYMYDYHKEMFDDIKASLTGSYPEYDKEAGFDNLYEKMWVDDSITGNASGSYFFNSNKATEAVKDNLGLWAEAMKEFCYTSKEIGDELIEERWEEMDVIIRCYLLNEILAEVLDELGC